MLSNGIKPSATSLSLLVLSSKDNAKRALSFFSEYRKYVTIDSRVYSSLLSVIQDNDPSKAKIVYNDIIKNDFVPDKFTISIILRCLAMSKNFELCIKALEKVCVFILLNGFGSNNFVIQTLNDWMDQIETDPFVFNVLLESATLASLKHMTDILDLIKEKNVEFRKYIQNQNINMYL